MEGLPRRSDDERMDAGMGRLLQIGVALASVTVLAGGAMYLRAHGGEVAEYRSFQGEAARLREWGQLLRAVGDGEAAAVIQMGVLLLIATPVARVVFALVAFALQRDRLYVGVSLVVLGVLLAGLFLLR